MREKILIKPPQIAWQPGPVFKFPYNMVYNCYEPIKQKKMFYYLLFV